MAFTRSRRSTVSIGIRSIAAAAIGCVVALLTTASPQAQAPKKLALVGGMLLTGYEVPPIHHAAVLIEGNTIVAAGPASEVKVPADATVVDTSGRVMLPGLIETHGHLIVLGQGAYDTWFPWIKSHGGDTMLTRVMEIAAKQLLMAGVTTTVDLGAPLAPILSIRDRINKGEVVGTRVLASGRSTATMSASSTAGSKAAFSSSSRARPRRVRSNTLSSSRNNNRPDCLMARTYPACMGVNGVDASSSAMPSTPVIGVRSSWPSTPMKLVLASLASSASWRAWRASRTCIRRSIVLRVRSTTVHANRHATRT